jgi:hypothetical protein
VREKKIEIGGWRRKKWRRKKRRMEGFYPTKTLILLS